MKQFVESWYGSPRTTAGGIIALGAVLGLLGHAISLDAAVTLLGVAATWIGIAGKDGGAAA
jgi:hypothetical protein